MLFDADECMRSILSPRLGKVSRDLFAKTQEKLVAAQSRAKELMLADDTSCEVINRLTDTMTM